jgi:hypothetical protein
MSDPLLSRQATPSGCAEPSTAVQLKTFVQTLGIRWQGAGCAEMWMNWTEMGEMLTWKSVGLAQIQKWESSLVKFIVFLCDILFPPRSTTAVSRVFLIQNDDLDCSLALRLDNKRW